MLLQLLGFFQVETSLRDVIEQRLPLLIDPDHTPTSIVEWMITIFNIAISAWMTPIYAISITILYYEHHSNKENLHIESHKTEL